MASIERKKRRHNSKYGSQPVSGHLEKWLEKETYVSLKTLLQVGGWEPYLRHVGVHWIKTFLNRYHENNITN